MNFLKKLVKRKVYVGDDFNHHNKGFVSMLECHPLITIIDEDRYRALKATKSGSGATVVACLSEKERKQHEAEHGPIAHMMSKHVFLELVGAVDTDHTVSGS